MLMLMLMLTRGLCSAGLHRARWDGGRSATHHTRHMMMDGWAIDTHRWWESRGGVKGKRAREGEREREPSGGVVCR
jgi:hypothetical protein